MQFVRLPPLLLNKIVITPSHPYYRDEYTPARDGIVEVEQGAENKVLAEDLFEPMTWESGGVVCGKGEVAKLVAPA